MNIYYVYILTNWKGNVMVIGVTNYLERRLYEHRQELIEGFTKRYHVHKLVYYEVTDDVRAALEREKQLKHWTRKKKNALVESVNPLWEDLSENREQDLSTPLRSAQDDSDPACGRNGERE